MGDIVSSGQSNDELIDNLVDANYISRKDVEMAFRAVDRADYMLPDHAGFAYRDVAWRHNQLHLSSPSIYCEVMNALDLGEKMSFLNIGSGTGYLSTVAGLLIGADGTNHGIEIHPEIVDYANRRLQEFLDDSCKFDAFEFCAPQFFSGNGLLMPEDAKYDRVYCGAACSYGPHLEKLKKLLKLGGKLVVPLNKYLMVYHLHASGECQLKNLLPVTFANMLGIEDPYNVTPTVPTRIPNSLQEKCRNLVRKILRNRVLAEHPELFQLPLSNHNEEDSVKKPKRSSRKRRNGSNMNNDGLASTNDEDSEPSGKNTKNNEDPAYDYPFDLSSVMVRMEESGVFNSDEDDEDEQNSVSSSTSSTISEYPDIPDNRPRFRKDPSEYQRKFSEYLIEKILALHLPKPISIYLNMNRSY